MRALLATLGGLLVGTLGCADALPRDADTFYAGRRLEIIVPFGPGGGSDTWARLIAPHLQQQLGQGSVVQVLNIVGATGIAGANEFVVRRRPDGLTALVTAGSTYFLYLLGEPAVRYDFRQLTPVLLSPVGGVIFVSPELGITDARQLRDMDRVLVYGGISATGNDIMALLAFEVLNLEVQSILGYTSKGASRVAFEQGETNIEYQTMPAYLTSVVPLVERGVAVPLMSFGVLDSEGGLVRDPSTPHLPTVGEVYRQIYGHEPRGPTWDAYKVVLGAGTMMQKVLWLHGNAPPEAVVALRRAAGALAEDSAFLAAAYAEIGEYPIYVGSEAERVISAVTDISPATVGWLKRLLREKHGVGRL